MKTILIFMNAGGSGIAASMLQDVAGGPLQPVSLNSTEHEGVDYVAVLAGCDVVSRCIELPNMSLNKQRRILPSLYDEYLGRGGEPEHFAIAGSQTGDGAMVLCVKESVVHAALNSLAEVGIHVKSCIADYFLVSEPTEGQTNTWTTPTGLVAVRQSNGSGYAMEAELMSHLARDVARDTTDAALVVNKNSLNFNILQGNFEVRPSLNTYGKALRRFAVLLAVAVMVAVVGYHIKTQNIEERAIKLSEETEVVFRNTFPEVTRIVDPVVQGRRIVSEMRNASGGAFLRLSDTIFASVRQHNRILVRGIRFNQDQNAFFLTVVSENFSVSDAFRQTLVAAGLRVTEGSSRQEAGKIVSDLAIEVLP